MDVLFLRNSNGWSERSRLSPIYKKYGDARGRKTVLVFDQDSVSQGPKQPTYLSDLKGNQRGRLRAAFATLVELLAVMTQAAYKRNLARLIGQPSPAHVPW